MSNNEKKSVKKALNSSNETVDRNQSSTGKLKNRPERVPLDHTAKLSIPAGVQEEGFAYRWITDKAERVESFERAWWVAVVDGNGRAIKKASGDGYLLLYRIEQKYYEEDVKAKQKLPIDLLVENAKLVKGNKHSSEYVPEGHQSVVTINN